MPVGKPRTSIRPSRQNLYRLWLIRSIFIAALFLASAWLRFFGAVEMPWTPLWFSLAGLTIIHAVLFFRLNSKRPVTEREFFTNLLLDIGFLTVILYLSGGSSNPLVSYYLIPLIVSAAVLSARFTWTIAALTVGCYTLLFYFYVPFDLFSMSHEMPGHSSAMGPHLVGMWINFVFSAVLISWFVVRMAATMREQQQSISRVREQGMRDEQIISVASIAAGTAHELRTPLATMTVLTDEMLEQYPELSKDLNLLQSQLSRCDSILRELISSTADSSKAQSATLERLFSDVLQEWRIARPEVNLDIDLPAACAAVSVCYDQSLHYALLSFLHNAADANPADISLAARNLEDEVLIIIEDRGPGIPAEIAASLGSQYISRKEGGLGLGILLSSATIERLDGTVALINRSEGGTRLEIRLPIQ